ncbi:hypothetical protein [Streptomyces sp. NPDC055058]
MANWADNRVTTAGLGSIVGVAASAVSGGACLANIGGILVTARVVAGLTVAKGDALLVARVGSAYFVQAVLQAGPVVPPELPPDGTEEDGVPAPDTGDAPPAPKPSVTTGSLVCTPVTTSTWRDGRWRTDIGSSTSADTYQGRYGGSSFGRNHGFAFYGSKPRSIAGATVTKATLKLRRLQAGDFAGRTPTLRLVSQSTRPGSFPTLNETTAGPRLAVGASSTFAIPKSWGQALVDGSRGGIAISIGSDNPYIRLAGRASWSAAWTLTLSWQRS